MELPWQKPQVTDSEDGGVLSCLIEEQTHRLLPDLIDTWLNSLLVSNSRTGLLRDKGHTGCPFQTPLFH